MLELAAVLLGGVLTLAGSYIGQRRAERVRAAEARQERFESYRDILGATIADVSAALHRMYEHSVRVMYVEGATSGERFDRAADVIGAEGRRVRQTVLRALVALPHGSPADVAGLLGDLHTTLGQLHEAAYVSALDEVALSNDDAPRPLEATTRASGLFEEAWGQLDALVTAAREAF